MNELATIRTVAKQVGFAKKVFTQGARGFSGFQGGAQLTSELNTILKLAGVQGKTVNVGLDSAQIILAGGAVVKGLDAGKSILQCAGNITEGFAGAVALLADLGILDKTVADFTGLAANGVMVISSAGANVLADIGLVISLIACVGDISSSLWGSRETVVRAAAEKSVATLNALIKGYTQPQIEYATTQLVLFKAGKLNPFDFISNVALHSPATFKKVFPGVAGYFPSWTEKTFSTVSGAVSGGIFGSVSETNSRSYTLTDILKTTPSEVKSILLNKFLFEPMQAYEPYLTTTEHISLKALSMLSMLRATTPAGVLPIEESFDVLGACTYLGVTPYHLGDDWLFKGFLRQESVPTEWLKFLPYPSLTIPYPGIIPTPGLWINGHPSYSSSELSTLRSAQELAALQVYMQRLDELGDIHSLMQIPEGRALLKTWADFKVPDVLGSIDLADYWKILSVFAQMESSDFLGTDTRKLEFHYGNLKTIVDQFEIFHHYVINKNLNRQARKNVANSIGIPIGRLATRHLSDQSLIFYERKNA